VPYHPETQPIESLWTRIKKDVAKKFRAGRTISQVIGQTHEAFKLATLDLIEKFVRKAEDAVTAHMKKLSLEVLHHQVDSLDELLARQPEGDEDEADFADTDEGISKYESESE